MVNTDKASSQLIEINKMLAPIMINKDDANDTTAIDTNSLMESISEVRLVSSLDGLASWMKA